LPAVFASSRGAGIEYLGEAGVRFAEARAEYAEALPELPDARTWFAEARQSAEAPIQAGVKGVGGSLKHSSVPSPADELRFTRDPFDALIVASAQDLSLLPFIARDRTIRESALSAQSGEHASPWRTSPPEQIGHNRTPQDCLPPGPPRTRADAGAIYTHVFPGAEPRAENRPLPEFQNLQRTRATSVLMKSSPLKSSGSPSARANA
jgi:hypothetical protein